jgi:K+-transporting ATPase ATPase A chain
MGNSGAHGFSEVFYAYTSGTNNNGSAFGGLTVTSDFFQSTIGIAMLFGRFIPILAVLALAGSVSAQRRVEPGAGTLPTDGVLFGVMVAGTVVILAALTFFPALGLGPIAEALA